MIQKDTDNPALLLIDIQKGFDQVEHWGGQRNNPHAEEYAAKLLDLWRLNGYPLFHIQHCSVIPGSVLMKGHPGNAFKDIVKPLPGETIIEKNVNSAFIGTQLKEKLDEAGIRKLVIVGLTTDHCVSTSTRMAGNYGYETYLVSDATATFDKKGIGGQLFPAALIHETALASLQGEFAAVVTMNQVIEKFFNKQ